MRTIPFRQVFDKTVRLYGRDSRKNISSDLRNAIVDHINDRVRTIWQCWRWPEWELTEERAFRQVWRSDHQYMRAALVDGRPDEVFYLGDGFTPGDDAFGDNYGYYRVVAGAPSDPPIGSVPGTDNDFWELIDPLDTFIAYDQGCKRAIGMVLGVYKGNPRVPTCNHNGILKYAPSERGIDVCGAGGPTVFITHKLPCPKFTMTPFVVNKTYVRADVVFDPVTGECFQALTTTTSALSTVDWRRIPFLDTWMEYVTKGAFADALMEFDQGGNGDLQAKVALQQYWNQQADDSLQSEVDALTTQGQKLTWNFCKPKCCGEWLATIPWSGNSSVTTLTDACDVDGYIYPIIPPPDPTSPCDTSYHDEIVSILTVDGSPSLEELPTVSRSVTCTLITIVIEVSGSPEAQQWRLDLGPADGGDPGQVAPADYDLSVNNKHWVKVG